MYKRQEHDEHHDAKHALERRVPHDFVPFRCRECAGIPFATLDAVKAHLISVHGDANPSDKALLRCLVKHRYKRPGWVYAVREEADPGLQNQGGGTFDRMQVDGKEAAVDEDGDIELVQAEVAVEEEEGERAAKRPRLGGGGGREREGGDDLLIA